MIKRLILNASLVSLLSCSSASTLENNFPEYEIRDDQSQSEKEIFSLLKEFTVIDSKELSFGWGRVEMLSDYKGKRIYHISFNAPDFIDPAYRLKRFSKKLEDAENVPKEDAENYRKFVEKYSGFEFEFGGKKYNLNKETIVLKMRPPALYVLVDSDNDKIPDKVAEKISLDENTAYLLEIEIGRLR